MIRLPPLTIVILALSCGVGARATSAETPTASPPVVSPPTASPPIAQAPGVSSGSRGQAPYCDRYAASEFDVQSPVMGLPFNRVDPKAAIPACREALSRDPTSARFNYQMGRAYAANREYSKAMEYFLKAANSNFALAELNIGSLYFSGLGVTRDYDVAAKWTRLAADQGLAPAAGNLGEMFLNGQGVPQNDALAAQWLALAAKQGYAPAQSRLATLYATGKGVKQNFAEALALNADAASQGYAPAIADLGSLSAMWQNEKQKYDAIEPVLPPAPDQPSAPAAVAVAADPPQPVAPDAAQPPPPIGAVEDSHITRAVTALAPDAPAPQTRTDNPPAEPPARELNLYPVLGGDAAAPAKLALRLLDHHNSSGVPITAIEFSPLANGFSLSSLSVNDGDCPVYARDPATLFLLMRHVADRGGKSSKDDAGPDFDGKYRRLALDYVPLSAPFDQPMTADFGQYLRFYVDPSACDIKDIKVVVNGKGWKSRQ